MEFQSEIEQLKQENQMLRYRADHDSLTNLLNRAIMEQKVNERMPCIASGTMMIFDIDDFKYINDQYGHLIGDRVLMGVAEALNQIFWHNDQVGRIGGDEFAAFVSPKCTQKLIDDKLKRLRESLKQLTKTLKLKRVISISFGSTYWGKGDDYCSLINRADAILLEKKKMKNKKTSSASYNHEAWPKEKTAFSSINTDIQIIQHQLQEKAGIQGAFYQDFDIFMQIYRFVERSLRRREEKIHIILLTLTDTQGEFITIVQQAKWMPVLHKVIQQHLRLGDAFTQYSSGQYIIMLVGISEDHIQKISKRICAAFHKYLGNSKEFGLKYDIYAMEGKVKSDQY